MQPRMKSSRSASCSALYRENGFPMTYPNERNNDAGSVDTLSALSLMIILEDHGRF
jgi:hypothetical protein